jgi:hypothetical protein
LLDSATTWSPGSASGLRHGRRLLLERDRVALRRGDGGDRAAHVAAGADLGGHRRDQALLLGKLGQVALEPRIRAEVTHDRRDLDLVHREHHRSRPAAAPELEAARRDRRERDLAAAELLWHERRQCGALAQRVDRLGREPGLPVDVIGVRRSDLAGDLVDVLQQDRVARRRGGHPATPASSSVSAAAIADTLSNTLRWSIRSGNSMSKASSSASITLTLACDVIPAWYRSASSGSVSMSTGMRP